MGELLELTLDLDAWEAGRATADGPVIDLSDVATGTEVRSRLRRGPVVVLVLVIVATSLAAHADRGAGSRASAADSTAQFATTNPHPRIPASTATTRGRQQQFAAYATAGSTYLSQVPRHR